MIKNHHTNESQPNIAGGKWQQQQKKHGVHVLINNMLNIKYKFGFSPLQIGAAHESFSPYCDACDCDIHYNDNIGIVVWFHIFLAPQKKTINTCDRSI